MLVIFTFFTSSHLLTANGLLSSPHYKKRSYWLRVKFGPCMNTAFQDKQYSLVCMLVSNLQSGQPSRVYSRLILKGEIKNGKLAARIQTSHSVCVEAPFGSRDLSRGWWWVWVLHLCFSHWYTSWLLECSTLLSLRNPGVIIVFKIQIAVFTPGMNHESPVSLLNPRLRTLGRASAESWGATCTVRGH